MPKASVQCMSSRNISAYTISTFGCTSVAPAAACKHARTLHAVSALTTSQARSSRCVRHEYEQHAVARVSRPTLAAPAVGLRAGSIELLSLSAACCLSLSLPSRIGNTSRNRHVTARCVPRGVRAPGSMGWLRRAHALALLALQLILAAQSSHGASESECNSMSIEEEGILCYALEDECKCDRPCAVYVVSRGGGSVGSPRACTLVTAAVGTS